MAGEEPEAEEVPQYAPVPHRAEWVEWLVLHWSRTSNCYFVSYGPGACEGSVRRRLGELSANHPAVQFILVRRTIVEDHLESHLGASDGK